MSSPDSAERVDVLLVQRACIDGYPPTRNQANLLAGRGLRVGVVDLAADGPPAGDLAPSVIRRQVHRSWNSKTEPPPSRWTRACRWLRFRRECRGAVRRWAPRVVIGYDLHACAHLPVCARGHRTVFHFHELPEPEPGMGVGPALSLRKVRGASRSADLVVFSDEHRGRCYQEEAALPSPPRIVMNCPMTIETVPDSPLRSLLRERGLPDGRVVVYIGSIGRNQGLPEAARSMALWPEDALMVLIGPSLPEVRDQVLAAAREAAAAERVVFLEPRPHAEALALAAGADIALSLIQPNTRNLLYSAGAVNKRFEYMALGLPQVTNTGPGVAEIVEHTRCGTCVDPASPRAVGEAVTRLLSDADQRRAMAANARDLHLRRFNYESQFAQVADWIEEAVHP